MRTHTTYTLRTLILNDMNEEKHKMTRQEIGTWTAMLPEITKEMFDTICFFTNSIFQRSLVGRQIRQIQHECITLLDHVDKYQNLPPIVDALKSAVIKCLDQVLEKIESDCSTYLDYEILMPSLHLKREKIAVESDMNLLVLALKNLAADRKLQKLIIECMTDLLKSARCYYYRMIYVKKLQESLIQLCKKTTKAGIDDDLMTHLLALNYNTVGFVKYYQQKVANELAACIEEEAQFEYLNLCENNFGNPHYRKSALSYDLKLRRVNHILHDFVRLELNIRHKRVALAREHLRAAELKQVTVVPKPTSCTYKIRTGLSVSALAYFIKLMIKARVIEPGVRTELLAFMAGIFQTPHCASTGISANSLGVKYNNVVQTSVTTVRVLLVRMLKLLDDEYCGV